MLVFLVPVGADRYELYCEEPDDVLPADEAPSGVFRRLVHWFREVLAEAERERRRGPSTDAPPSGFMSRLKARTLRWVSESIAEQRLLWQLRGRVEAGLVYPDDLRAEQASEILRRSLRRDFERHRFWLVIDGLGLIASAALMLLPGPNLVALLLRLPHRRALPVRARGAAGSLEGGSGTRRRARRSRRFGQWWRWRPRRGLRAWMRWRPRCVSSTWPASSSAPRRRDARGRGLWACGVRFYTAQHLTLTELAERLGCRLEGDGDLEIDAAWPGIERAGPGDLTFFANPRYASQLRETRAIGGDRSATRPPGALRRPSHARIRISRSRNAVALFAPRYSAPAGVHPTRRSSRRPPSIGAERRIRAVRRRRRRRVASARERSCIRT